MQCLWYFNQDANAPMIIDQSSNTHQSWPPSQGQQCLDSDDASNFNSNMESDEDEIQRPQVSFATCCQQEQDNSEPASSSSLSNTDSSEDSGTESDIEPNQDDDFNLQRIGQAIHEIWAGMDMEDLTDLNSKIYYFYTFNSTTTYSLLYNITKY